MLFAFSPEDKRSGMLTLYSQLSVGLHAEISQNILRLYTLTGFVSKRIKSFFSALLMLQFLPLLHTVCVTD